MKNLTIYILTLILVTTVSCISKNSIKISNMCQSNNSVSDKSCDENNSEISDPEKKEKNPPTISLPSTYSCYGEIPKNSVLCINSDISLKEDTQNNLAKSCPEINKCVYKCLSNYKFNLSKNNCEEIINPVILPETSITPAGGTFTEPKSIILSSNIESIIYYTLDGSEPSIQSSKYSTPLTITQNTTLKYFAVDNLGNQENIKSDTFIINIDDNSCIQNDQPFQAGTHSTLWGANGEMWDPHGWLPDFSYAGYHAGEKAIPNINTVANVKTDYGAIGDGINDDTQAFKNAIAATNNGALFIPRGRYKISEPLFITKSNFVLRGEGKGPSDTVLFFNKGLTAFNSVNKKEWASGNGGMIWAGYSNIDNAFDKGTPKSYLLATITEDARRGDTKLKVSDLSKIVVEQYVVLHLKDNLTTKTFARYLNNNYQNATSLIENAPSVAKYLYWPVKVIAINSATNEITLQQPLRYPLRAEWNPRLWFHTPSVKEVGIENLRIEFPDIPLTEHHPPNAYNGINFINSINSWIKNVAIKNYDNGIATSNSKHITITDVDLLARSTNNQLAMPIKGNSLCTAHHGVLFAWHTSDILLTNYYFDGLAAHEITIVALANGNVIRNGSGIDLTFDAHRALPFSNLFTANDMGLGNYPYVSSGGPVAGTAHLGVYNTFWGNTASSWSSNYLQPRSNSPSYANIKTIFVPSVISRNNDFGYNENLNNEVSPRDLYQAQLRKRTNLCE